MNYVLRNIKINKGEPFFVDVPSIIKHSLPMLNVYFRSYIANCVGIEFEDEYLHHSQSYAGNINEFQNFSYADMDEINEMCVERTRFRVEPIYNNICVVELSEEEIAQQYEGDEKLALIDKLNNTLTINFIHSIWK